MNDFNQKYRRYYVERSEWQGLSDKAQFWNDVRTFLVSDTCPRYGARKHFEDNHNLTKVEDKLGSRLRNGAQHDPNADEPLNLASDDSVSCASTSTSPRSSPPSRW